MSSVRTDDNTTFINELSRPVGHSHLLTDPAKTARYRKGFRSGQGEALAVVFPGTLLELWRVLSACVAADKIILMQAANTGLTEGSTPNGNDYDRDIVIISTLRLDKLHLLDKGEQVLAFPGTTLYSLEKALKPLGREPHSVIGSSCIGASVIGGICNNSGGSLVQRGPAYTEMSLFARIDENGKLTLVNHLGIDLGVTPEQILSKLDDDRVKDEDVQHDGRHAHDHDYITRVRDINADTPARYNADPDRLFESSGCAGKLAVLRCASIPSRQRKAAGVLHRHQSAGGADGDPPSYSGRVHSPAGGGRVYAPGHLRHRRALRQRYLPDDRQARHRQNAVLLHHEGPHRCDAGESVALQAALHRPLYAEAGQRLPGAFTGADEDRRDKYEHHLLLKMAGDGIDEAQSWLTEFFKTADGDFFACTPEEGSKAFLHRFAAAGAAIRYQAVHSEEVEDILALDIALRRNDTEWFEHLPPEIDSKLVHKLYYGHFMCYVFHRDYIVKKGLMHTR